MVGSDLLLPTDITSALCLIWGDQYVPCQETHRTNVSAAIIHLQLTIVTSYAGNNQLVAKEVTLRLYTYALAEGP